MQRNVAIDIFKYVAALLVIGIHIHPFEQCNAEADFVFSQIVCRLAVPFFAVCTGYYMLRQWDAPAGHNFRGIGKSVRKTLWLYVGWSAFYLLVFLLQWSETPEVTPPIAMTAGWLKSACVGASYYHLWYLYHLAVALLLLYLVLRFVPQKFWVVTMVVLWGIEVVEYGYRDFVPEAAKVVLGLCDKFIFFVSAVRMLPLLLAGAVIGRFGLLGKHSAAIGFVLSFLLLVVEAHALRASGVERYSFIICTLPSVYCLFCLLAQGGSAVRGNFDSRRLARISMIIYCLHPAVIWLLRNELKLQSCAMIYLLTCAVTTLAGLFYYQLSHRRKQKAVAA